MIMINQEQTEIDGQLIDISAEMQSGLFAIIDVMRRTGGDELALEFVKDCTLGMMGYVEGISLGKSHEGCIDLALKKKGVK